MNIILLHGWGVDHKIFDDLYRKLSRSLNVYRFDFPGFGENKLDKVYNLDDYVAYLYNYIKDLELSNVILVGHSFGGRVAIKYASKYKVNKIILLNGAGIRLKGFKYYKRIICNKIFKLLHIKKNFNTVDFNNSSGYLKETFINIINEDLRDVSKTIKNKTLLIYSKNDKDTPYKIGKIYKKYIKNSHLIKVNTGHYSFLESKFAIPSIIKSFIKED